MRRRKSEIQFFDFRAELGLELVHGRAVGQTVARHTHRALCVGLVEEGTRVFTCQETTYCVKAGEVFLIPPHEVHVCNVSSEPHTYKLLLASSLFYGELFPRTARQELVMGERTLYEELQGVHTILIGTAEPLVKQTAVVEFLGKIAGFYAPQQPDECERTIESRAIRVVQEYIDEHYADNLRLELLAQQAFLSPWHFLRLFGKIAGVPPHIYQQQARIRRARDLLTAGSSPAEVALATGFYDQSHFTNAFKKLMGVTPKDFIAAYVVTDIK